MAALGFFLITWVNSYSGVALLVISSFIYSLGLAPVFTLTTDIIVSAAPPERAGVASAISETGSEFGGALGIAILGSIGIFIFRREVANGFAGNIPDDILNSAKQTLSAAIIEAENLPSGQSNALISTAKQAFVSGMKAVAFACAVLVLVMAFLMWLRMKKEKQDLVRLNLAK